MTVNFNFVDKAILANASVFGLSEDNHLKGNQYSWISSSFYFGYLLWEYPTAILIPKISIGKYVGANIIACGVVVAGTSACSSYHQLMTARFLTGALEATVSPAFLYITSIWYSRDEIPSRMGVWYAGNAFGGALAGILSYGISHVESTLKPWRWLYLISGSATALWGVVVLLFLPDTMATADFLTKSEKSINQKWISTRVTEMPLSSKSKWKFEQVIECFIDPKTWLFVLISLLTQIPNGGTQSFANLALKGFGFTALQSTLIPLPASLISVCSIIITGWLATRNDNIVTLLITAMSVPPIIGSTLMNWGGYQGIQLCGYYLLGFSHCIIPLTMSLVGSNVRGTTKKMTISALVFIAYCTGNIIGPQLFHQSEAPHYPTAFKAITLSYALAGMTSVVLRYYLIGVNLQRDAVEIPVLDTGSPAPIQTDDDSEATDFNTAGFRYRF